MELEHPESGVKSIKIPVDHVKVSLYAHGSTRLWLHGECFEHGCFDINIKKLNEFDQDELKRVVEKIQKED